MTVGCARAPHLCVVVSVSENHLETEMPCNMFVRVSGSGPRVSLAFPPPGDAVPLHPEAFFVAVELSNFVLGRDGSVCVTWSGGRRCSSSAPAMLVTDADAGDLDLRAELLGRDGLPLASSGAPRHVTLTQAMSPTPDYEGEWLDSRASIGARLAAGGLAGAGLVVGDATSAAPVLRQVRAPLDFFYFTRR